MYWSCSVKTLTLKNISLNVPSFTANFQKKDTKENGKHKQQYLSGFSNFPLKQEIGHAKFLSFFLNTTIVFTNNCFHNAFTSII